MSKNNYSCRTDGSEHEEHEAATESQVKRDGNDGRQAIDHRISRISGIPAEVRRRARATVASATIELRLRSQWPAIGLVSSFQFRGDRVLNSPRRILEYWRLQRPHMNDRWITNAPRQDYRPSVTTFPLSSSGKREKERERERTRREERTFHDSTTLTPKVVEEQ